MMKNKGDIIQRAYELIQCNAMVKKTGCDYWQRIDASLNVAYEVRLSSCTCNFWTIHNQGRELQLRCKHQLSCFAAPVVRFIVKMRQCQTVDALVHLVETEAPRIANELPEFVAMANHEMHLMFGRLKDAPQQVEQQQPAPKQKREAKYRSKSVRKNGENITMIQQKEAPSFYQGIQIV